MTICDRCESRDKVSRFGFVHMKITIIGYVPDLTKDTKELCKECFDDITKYINKNKEA